MMIPSEKEQIKWLFVATFSFVFVTSLHQMRPSAGFIGGVNPCNNGSLWDSQFDNVSTCTPEPTDPFHESVTPFLKVYNELLCHEGNNEPLVYAVDKTLYVNHKVISAYNNPVTCWYRPFDRESEGRNKYGRPELLEDSVDVTDEFIQVHCVEENGPLVYVDIFAFIVPKPRVEARCSKAFKNKASRSASETIQIVVIGLGSTSLTNFQRYMNGSYNFIRKYLTWVQLKGYNKLSLNSYGNVVPILTGRLQREVVDTAKQQADVLPFVWADFAKHGFRTLYGEDSVGQETFNFRKKGFYNQPTDYYLRPLALQFELALKRQTWKLGCWNYRSETSIILQWVEDFTDMFAEDPFFAFAFFNRFIRDDLNGLQLYDKLLLNFLENLYTKGRFENMFLFIVSDHGGTHGDFRQTYKGLTEGKQPLALLVLPEWLSLKYPLLYENLLDNSDKLTTPLDIFDTLRDLAHFSKLKVRSGQIGRGRSISLLTRRVLANRTCQEAGIPLAFCSCLEFQSVPTDLCQATSAANALVDKINSFTATERRKCAFLEPLYLLNAYATVTGLHSPITGSGSVALTVIVQVKPGHGIYEGFVQYDPTSRMWVADNEITRLDSFDSGQCVSSFTVKPFCYCLRQRKRFI